MTTIQTFERDVCLTAALIIGAAMSVFAHAEYVQLCASTSEQLQTDLADASNGGKYSGDDVRIYLVSGIYRVGSATHNGPFTYASSAATGFLDVEGGYDSQCQNRTAGPESTILDGESLSQVLTISNRHAFVDVIGLSIRNGNSTSDDGGGMVVNSSGSGNTIQITGDIFSNNKCTGCQGGGLVVYSSDDSATVQVLNNVFVGNSALVYGAALVSAGDMVPSVQVWGNTVYGNHATSANGVGGLACCGAGVQSGVNVFANIFWQNSNYGLYLFGPAPVYLDYNDYGTRSGGPPFEETGTFNGDPQFVDAANSNFHLSAGSPLIGHTPANANVDNDGDIDGNSRPYLSVSDTGAYEDTIFSGGLEAN